MQLVAFTGDSHYGDSIILLTLFLSDVASIPEAHCHSYESHWNAPLKNAQVHSSENTVAIPVTPCYCWDILGTVTFPGTMAGPATVAILGTLVIPGTLPIPGALAIPGTLAIPGILVIPGTLAILGRLAVHGILAIPGH